MTAKDTILSASNVYGLPMGMQCITSLKFVFRTQEVVFMTVIVWKFLGHM